MSAPAATSLPAPTPRPTPPARPAAAAASRLPHGPALDLRHFFLVFQERWLGAFGLALLVCGLLGYYLLSRPPVYSAMSSLLVERNTDHVVEMKQVEDNTAQGGDADTLLLTHIEQLAGHSFYTRLVASFTPAERESILAPYRTPGPPDAKAAPPTSDDLDRQLEGFISKNVAVARAKRTLLIDITASHRDPKVAQLLANRTAEQYVGYLANRSSDSNTAAVNFLNTQVEDLRKKVELADQNLQAYREKYNLVSVADNQNVVAQRLQALSTSVTQARIARQALDDRVQQLEDVMAHGSDQLQIATLAQFDSSAGGKKLDNLTGVQEQIDKLRADRVVLAERYGAQHPAMQANARSLEELGKLRQQYLDAAVADVKNQRDAAVVQQQQIEQAYAKAEEDSLNLSKLSVGYNVLLREVETTRQIYTALLARQNETTITSQLQNTNVKVVDRAAVPERPTSPNLPKIGLILAFLGGVIMCGYPLAADSMDDRIKSWHDAETYLGATLLGEISQAVNVAKDDCGSIVAEDLDEGVVEAFRSLHSQLLISTKLEAPRTILVTSTVPGEGKSFVSANLAAAFAAHGNRTLLIDCDFRRPSQHQFAGLDNKLGVMPWLALNTPPGANLAADPSLGIVELSPRNFLLRTGGTSRKISELLANGNLSALIEALQSQFDIVIMDTPPSGVFPDSEIFARLADELIYICRFKGPRRTFTRQVLLRLLKADLHFAGIVMNAMPLGRSQSYYYSGYGYYYSRKDYKKYYKSRDPGDDEPPVPRKKPQTA
jgi:capsular exopolysaccharide synthesis family protein